MLAPVDKIVNTVVMTTCYVTYAYSMPKKLTVFYQFFRGFDHIGALFATVGAIKTVTFFLPGTFTVFEKVKTWSNASAFTCRP